MPFTETEFDDTEFPLSHNRSVPGRKLSAIASSTFPNGSIEIVDDTLDIVHGILNSGLRPNIERYIRNSGAIFDTNGGASEESLDDFIKTVLRNTPERLMLIAAGWLIADVTVWVSQEHGLDRASLSFEQEMSSSPSFVMNISSWSGIAFPTQDSEELWGQIISAEEERQATLSDSMTDVGRNEAMFGTGGPAATTEPSTDESADTTDDESMDDSTDETAVETATHQDEPDFDHEIQIDYNAREIDDEQNFHERMETIGRDYANEGPAKILNVSPYGEQIVILLALPDNSTGKIRYDEPTDPDDPFGAFCRAANVGLTNTELLDTHEVPVEYSESREQWSVAIDRDLAEFKSYRDRHRDDDDGIGSDSIEEGGMLSTTQSLGSLAHGGLATFVAIAAFPLLVFYESPHRSKSARSIADLDPDGFSTAVGGAAIWCLIFAVAVLVQSFVF
ncbi:hypothetical protein [Halosegnis longus]|uniref:hypothetical protein n=1 Tax=Halosegnis longus TaxID=2216012 RepID=UPI00129DC047|nr:hypothetical protein [Halosegnis longus]